MTLEELRTEVQQRLGDTGETLWSDAELNAYIQQGYDRLTMETGILWDVAYFPDYPNAFNYTATFELPFLEEHTGWRISGLAQYTALFERDFVDNAIGPANHNFHWEFNGGFVTVTLVSGVVDLPEDLYQIERATWNNIRLEPLRSRELEMHDFRYELNTGQVEGYIQDKDGLGTLRKWRVPSAAYTGYDYASGSNDFGLLRVIDDVDSGHVDGFWGELTSVPGHDVSGGPWGIIRQIYSPISNLKIEYRRRGRELSVDATEFELPDRYVKYVRWFALSQALGRDGDGQDMDLAKHYEGRFEAGIQRILQRRSKVQAQKLFVMGGRGPRNQRPPLVRLPWQYGKVVR